MLCDHAPMLFNIILYSFRNNKSFFYGFPWHNFFFSLFLIIEQNEVIQTIYSVCCYKKRYNGIIFGNDHFHIIEYCNYRWWQLNLKAAFSTPKKSWTKILLLVFFYYYLFFIFVWMLSMHRKVSHCYVTFTESNEPCSMCSMLTCIASDYRKSHVTWTETCLQCQYVVLYIVLNSDITFRLFDFHFNMGFFFGFCCDDMFSLCV